MEKVKNFNFKLLLSRVLVAATRLVPYRIRTITSRTPWLRSLIGKFLNLITSSESLTIMEITAGPLKGFRLGVDLRANRWHWLGIHEPEVFATLQKLVKKDMIIYDVGAALGSHSLLLARLCGFDKGRVYAFEPDIFWFSRLVKNLEINSVKNVEPLQLAVSQVSGTTYIGRPSETDFWRLIENKPEGWEVMETFSIALDDFCKSNPPPDFLKIDTEGGEAQVLLGAKKILDKNRPIVLCELHGPNLARQAWEILQEHDYLSFYLENHCSEVTYQNIASIPIAHHIIACHKENLSILQKAGLIKETFK